MVYTLDPKTFPGDVDRRTKTRCMKSNSFVQGGNIKSGVYSHQLHLYGVEEGGTIIMLGTDKMGRDLWGKACEAGRISLSMSLFGTIISVVVGSVLGVALAITAAGSIMSAALHRVCHCLPAIAAVDGPGGTGTQDRRFVLGLYRHVAVFSPCFRGRRWRAKCAARCCRCAKPISSWRPRRWALRMRASSSATCTRIRSAISS